MTAPRSDPPDHDTNAPRAEDAEPARTGVGRGLGTRESAELAGVVGGLIGAGVALPGGLRALAEESESSRLRRILNRLADRIERGESLGEAIAAEGHRVPDHLPGIIRAAEQSGREPDVLLEAVRFERMNDELFRHLITRLAYPTLLLCAAVIVFLLIARFITLDLVSLYEDFGVALPALTIALVALSRWVDSAGWALLVGSVLMVLLAIQVARGATSRRGRRVTNRIPVFGAIWRNSAMAEFSGLLAILIEARLAMPEALRLAGRGVRDSDLIAACTGASHLIEKGQSLLDASRAYRLFPTGFDRLLAWAEANQVLPDALRLASEVYSSRAQSQAVVLGVFLSAIVVALVLIGVILIVFGLYLPLLKLISGLTGGPSLLW